MRHPLEQFIYCPECGGKFAEHNGKSKKCLQCGFTYYFNPSAATVAIITNEKNELLVTRRAKDPCRDTLDLPGGFVDSFETGEEGVIREVKEETGLTVISAEYLFSLPNIYVYSGFEVHTLDLFYRCRVKSTENMAAQDDIEESMFIPIDKINIDDFGLTSVKRGLKMLIDNNYLNL